jgi:hypothetical protein
MADELLFSDVANYRYNPFTDKFSPNVISNENRTIPASPPYQVVLFESPQENSPSTTNITLTIGGTQLTEVSKTTTPGNLQYRVNYDEQSNGIVEFNSGQAGLEVDIDYYGLGTLYSKDAVEALLFDGTKTFENITVTNDLSVGNDVDITNDLTVTNDIYSGANSKFSTGGETTPDCLDGGITTLTKSGGTGAGRVITFKQTGYAHGITSFEETDTYGVISNIAVNSRGMNIRGLTTSKTGVSLESFITTEETSTANITDVPLSFTAVKKSGTSVTSLSSSAIMFSLTNASDSNNAIWVLGNGDFNTTGNITCDTGIDAGNSGTYLKTKVVDIGDWNMDTTTSVNVAHGLSTDALNIRGIQCVIRNDSNTVQSPLNTWGSTATVAQGQLRSWTTTNVTLDRLASGFYDNTSYDSTSYNRGWIYITYEA